MEKNKPGSTPEFLDRLAELLANISGQSLDEMKEDLRHEGVDTEKLLARVRAMVEHKLPQPGWQERARQERTEARAALAARPRMKMTPTALKSAATEFEQHVHFRKFEKATDADLESLLEDRETLRQLEELERQKNSGQG